MGVVRVKTVAESPFKQKWDSQTQDRICSNWIDDLTVIFNNHNQSAYLNMRDAQEYLGGIYDVGHIDGTHQAIGGNLITLITKNDGDEPQ